MWTSILRKLKKKSRVKIRTPVAVMGVKGTQFNTVFQPVTEQLEVIVVEGRVEVLPPSQVEGLPLEKVEALLLFPPLQ